MIKYLKISDVYLYFSKTVSTCVRGNDCEEVVLFPKRQIWIGESALQNPREYCFWCMNKLPSEDGVCGHCKKSNSERKNGNSELPFSLLAGKYLIGKALGRGGFGITYVGLNISLGKRVAVKEYFPAEISVRADDGINVEAASSESESLFEEGKLKALEEARLTARIQNVPNVVGIYDCFSGNNTVYIIMEFIEGQTFAEYAKAEGCLRWQTLWPVIRPVGAALGQIHRLNLVHRDISPDNMMIRKDTGESVLLDFGAASGVLVKGQAHETALKDGYAPIEQYQSYSAIDGRTDEYSWCATIWYMLTGNRPPSALQRKNQQCDPVMSGRIRRKVPECVRWALLKGMAVYQEDRYPDMEQLIIDLDGESRSFSSGRIILAILAAAAFLILLLSLIAGFLS